MNTRRPQPKCVTLPGWLRANLGPCALALLTGTDSRCLSAAVMVVEAYSYCPCDELAHAFGACVSQMQRSTRQLAFHAVAHVMDWNDRPKLWLRAGLQPMAVSRCAYEPEGESAIGVKDRAQEGGSL